MISPCRCSGSIKYVHQLCLKEWMQVRIGEIKDSAISCELCKSNIKVDISLMSRCKTYRETCKAVKEDLFNFVAAIGVLFIALWIFGFAIAHLILIMTKS
jgi:E3 ubiquitin-protein ligase DOA10